MKKKRRLLQSDTFWGLTAALLVVLQFWWLPGEDGSASDSYSTTLDGKLGLYRTLSQLFPSVERDALLVVPEDRACLILTSPDRYPNDQEQTQLYEFVYGGGTLLFAPNWNNPEFELRSLGIHTTARLLSDSTTATPTMPLTVPVTPSGLAEMPTDAAGAENEAVAEAPTKSASELEMDAIPPNATKTNTAQTSSPSAPPAAKAGNAEKLISSREEMLKKKTPGLTPAPGLESSPEEFEAYSTSGEVGETVEASSDLVDGAVEWNSNADLEVPAHLATETLVTSASDRVEVATWPMGSGRVVVCSSPDIFSNRSMLDRGSRRLAVRLVERGYLHNHEDSGQQTPIVLSEFFNASDSYAQTGVLLSPSLRIGTLQLLLVAVLGIWLAFYRFGPAQEVSTLQRRSLTESAQAVGNLQYRLSDGGAVIRSYLEYIRSQLRRRYGSIVRLDQPEALALRAGMNVDEVRDRLAEAQALTETVQLSPAKTAACLRWLAAFQHRVSGSREEKAR